MVKLLLYSLLAFVSVYTLDNQAYSGVTKTFCSLLFATESAQDLVDDAKAALNRELTINEEYGVTLAHEVGFGEVGKDGIELAGINEDGTTNYTLSHISQKFEILIKSGFSRNEARRLLDLGIIGYDRYAGLPANIKEMLLKNKKKFLKEDLNSYSKDSKDYEFLRWRGVGKMPYEKIYKRVFDFLNDPKRVFARLEEFEIDIMKQVFRPGNRKTREEHMLRMIEKQESKHGFKKAIEINEELPAFNWREMLKQGALFNDNKFYQLGHGKLTHRIQFYLIMKEIDANPNLYTYEGEAVTASILFKQMGDYRFSSSLELPNQVPDMWFFLVDSQSNTLRSPERMMHIKMYLPFLQWK